MLIKPIRENGGRAMADTTHFAVKSTGDDNVERLHITTVLSAFPTSATLPANATADVKATVAALEALLAGKVAAPIPPGAIGNEAQLIQH
jgi:hypothetical protein